MRRNELGQRDGHYELVHRIGNHQAPGHQLIEEGPDISLRLLFVRGPSIAITAAVELVQSTVGMFGQRRPDE